MKKFVITCPDMGRDCVVGIVVAEEITTAHREVLDEKGWIAHRVYGLPIHIDKFLRGFK